MTWSGKAHELMKFQRSGAYETRNMELSLKLKVYYTFNFKVNSMFRLPGKVGRGALVVCETISIFVGIWRRKLKVLEYKKIKIWLSTDGRTNRCINTKLATVSD